MLVLTSIYSQQAYPAASSFWHFAVMFTPEEIFTARQVIKRLKQVEYNENTEKCNHSLGSLYTYFHAEVLSLVSSNMI